MASTHPLILQLDSTGNPVGWITYQTAAMYYTKDLVSWTPADNHFTIYGGSNRITGQTSFLDINTIIATKGHTKCTHKQPVLKNASLFRRDNNICGYCGKQLKSSALTRDHVIPKSKNGQDTWTNVVTACGACNRFKSDRTPEQAGMKLLYVPYTPSTAEYLILMNRNILADQMEFLMARVSKNSRLRARYQ